MERSGSDASVSAERSDSQTLMEDMRRKQDELIAAFVSLEHRIFKLGKDWKDGEDGEAGEEGKDSEDESVDRAAIKEEERDRHNRYWTVNRCLQLDFEIRVISLDYQHESLCDSRESPTHYSKVVKDLESLVSPSHSDHISILGKTFTLDLSRNYLQDEGVTAICNTILKYASLREALTSFLLTHNRFTDKSLMNLKALVLQCPNLESLDFSINPVRGESFRAVFGDLPDGLKAKVKFSVY